jgi:hypothetical protein
MTNTEPTSEPLDRSADIHRQFDPLMQNLRQTSWEIGDLQISLNLNTAETAEAANHYGLSFDTFHQHRITATEYKASERTFRSFTVHSILLGITDREKRFEVLHRPDKVTTTDAQKAVRSWKIEQGLTTSGNGSRVGKPHVMKQHLPARITKGGSNLDGIKIIEELFSDGEIKITIEHPVVNEAGQVERQGIIWVKLATDEAEVAQVS